jgi:hypothetical protein
MATLWKAKAVEALAFWQGTVPLQDDAGDDAMPSFATEQDVDMQDRPPPPSSRRKPKKPKKPITRDTPLAEKRLKRFHESAIAKCAKEIDGLRITTVGELAALPLDNLAYLEELTGYTGNQAVDMAASWRAKAVEALAFRQDTVPLQDDAGDDAMPSFAPGQDVDMQDAPLRPAATPPFGAVAATADASGPVTDAQPPLDVAVEVGALRQDAPAAPPSAVATPPFGAVAAKPLVGDRVVCLERLEGVVEAEVTPGVFTIRFEYGGVESGVPAEELRVIAATADARGPVTGAPPPRAVAMEVEASRQDAPVAPLPAAATPVAPTVAPGPDALAAADAAAWAHARAAAAAGRLDVEAMIRELRAMQQ